MSGTEAPLYQTTAGADLSTTGQFLFIYLDAADSYKAKLLTPALVSNPTGVLQNAPADDAVARYRRGPGIATVTACGTITPWAPVTVDSASKAVVAGPGDVILGYLIPKNTAAGVLASAAATDTVKIMLVNNDSQVAQSGVAVGYHDFATDGDATIALRDVTATSGSTVVIPSGAMITYAHVYVDTTYTSSGDIATIGLALGGVTIVTAVAIGTGTPWDAGGRNAIQVGTGLTSEPTTSAAALTATIGVEAITAGAMRVYVHYTVAAAE